MKDKSGNGLIFLGIMLGAVGFLLIVGAVALTFTQTSLPFGAILMVLGAIFIFVAMVLVMIGMYKKMFANMEEMTTSFAKKTRKSTEIHYEAVGKGLRKGTKGKNKVGVVVR